MDISIKKEDLIKALYFSQNIVERRTTMPILSNFLLSASDGVLKVSASDLEITCLSTAPANVKSSGSITVNAKIISELVRELPEGTINIKVSSGNRLEVVAGKSKSKIVGVSAEEFPNLPGIFFEPESKVRASELLDMINKTLYAVSADETRYNLNGVCFECINGKSNSALRLVATDGHRLALVTRPVASAFLDKPVIVPKKGLSEIRKILDSEGERDIGVMFKDGFMIIQGASAKMSIRLIDGEFPDYNQVLPKTTGQKLIIRSGEFMQALKRVSLMVTDKGKCVRLDLTPDTAKISSSSPELGEASEELGVTFSGKNLSIGFNGRYVQDLLASINEDQDLTIELNGELGPGKFYPASDESYQAVIMPMRLM